MSIVPSQKFGIEIPIRAEVVSTLSVSLSFLRAEMIPQGIPTMTESIIAAQARFSVLGRRTIISSSMGCFVVKLVPRSRVSSFLRYITYCVKKLSLSPRLSLTLSISSSVAPAPATIAAGSPGAI